MSTWEVTCKITGGGAAGSGPFYNIFHVHTPDDSPAMATSVTAAFTAFYTAIKAIYPTSSSVQTASKIVRVDTDPPVFVPSTPGSVTGSGSSTLIPPQICYVIAWKTAVATRGGRGRNYLGPLTNGVLQSDGALFSTQIGPITTAGTNLIAALKAIDPVCSLVIWRRPVKAGPGVPAIPGHETPVVTCSVSNNPYTQRRRAQ